MWATTSSGLTNVSTQNQHRNGTVCCCCCSCCCVVDVAFVDNDVFEDGVTLTDTVAKDVDNDST